MLMLLVLWNTRSRASPQAQRGQDYGIIPWRLQAEKAEIRKAPVGSDIELVACYLGLLSIGRSLQAPVPSIWAVPAVPAVRSSSSAGREVVEGIPGRMSLKGEVLFC